MAATFWAVPAGTPAARCSCGATMYFIRTVKGSQMPVDCAIDGGEAPTATAPGRGVSHFATCPKAQIYRRPKPKPSRC